MFFGHNNRKNSLANELWHIYNIVVDNGRKGEIDVSVTENRNFWI